MSPENNENTSEKLSEFAKLIQEAKKAKLEEDKLLEQKLLEEKLIEDKKIAEKEQINALSETEKLSEFAKLIKEGKEAKKIEVKQETENKKKQLSEKFNLNSDAFGSLGFLSDLMKAKSEKTITVVENPEYVELPPIPEEPKIEPVAEVVEQPIEEQKPTETIISRSVKAINKISENTNLLTASPVDKVDPTFKAVQDKLKFLEQWIGKISAAGPGSGSYWLNDLGDTDKFSIKSATDGQVLTFSATLNKWIAADAPSGPGGPSIDQYARNTANSASSNTVIIQAVDIYQNTNIASAQSFANGAFAVANSGASFANGAFVTANSASSNTVIIQGVNNTQNTNIQSAWNQANSANILAQSAYNYANNMVLNSLGDVLITGPTNGQLLTYVSSLGKWVNQTANAISANTSVGYYGSFFSMQTQSVPSAGANTAMTYDTTAGSNGTIIDPSSNSHVKVLNSGVYNFQFSSQFHNNGGGGNGSTVTVWFAVNGVPIANSATNIAVNTNSPYIVASWNIILELNANDYLQMVWSSDNANIIMQAIPATATIPGIPSVILTVQQVTAVQTDQANSAASFANSAFITANSASSNTVVTQGVDATQNTNIASAQSFANSAFTKANTAYSTAMNAYSTASVVAIDVQSAYDKANGAFNKANTAITTSGGTITGSLTVNGTTTSNSSTAFYAGDAAISGVALQMPQEGALRNLTNGLTNMYFDVSIGGTTQGQFQFRSSSAYTNILTMSPTAVSFNTGATVTARTPSLARTAFNSAIDTEITVDELRFRISNQGGIFPQVISNTGGSKNLGWTGVGAISGTAVTQVGSTGTIVANNAWTTLYNAHGMDSAADTVTVTLQDKVLGRIYRVTFMRSDNGSTTGYNIIAERLL